MEKTPYPIKALEDIIVQLIKFLGTLQDEQYTKPLDVISGNSIGKHTRHILEGIESLDLGYNTNEINYDIRKRQEIYENNVIKTQNKLLELLESLESKTDKPLSLLGDYTAHGDGASRIQTSYFREVTYNVEHAVHHMAIIKIATKVAFPYIPIDQTFGVAYSTIRFQNAGATS